jgi:hypothetical protein
VCVCVCVLSIDVELWHCVILQVLLAETNANESPQIQSTRMLSAVRRHAGSAGASLWPLCWKQLSFSATWPERQPRLRQSVVTGTYRHILWCIPSFRLFWKSSYIHVHIDSSFYERLRSLTSRSLSEYSLNEDEFEGSEVLTAVVMKNSIFWDGGDLFLRNVYWILTDCMALYPRR